MLKTYKIICEDSHILKVQSLSRVNKANEEGRHSGENDTGIYIEQQ